MNTQTPRRRISPAFVSGPLLLTAAILAQMAAYRQAQTHGDTPAAFGLFWLGMGALFVPVLARLLTAQIDRVERTAIILGLGVVTYLPKVLRATSRPAFGDEIAQLDAANRLLHGAPLFASDSILPVLRDYPGLRVATVAVHEITRLSLWPSGLLLIGVCHLATLFAIYELAKRGLRDSGLAIIATAVYALSPGFTFFTSLFVYESLALPMMLWALLFATWASNPARSPRARAAYFVGFLLLMVATVFTHHVTSIVLVLALTLLFLAERLARHRQLSWRPLLVMLLIAAAVTGSWLAYQGTGLFTYIFPSGSIISHAITGFFRSAPGTRHKVFSGTTLPKYEVLSGLLAPLLAVGFGLVGAWSMRRKIRSVIFLVSVPSLIVYAATVPLVLSAQLEPIAHRSWPFLWVGVAPVIAIGVSRSIARVGRISPNRFAHSKRTQPGPRRPGTARLQHLAVVGAVGLLAVMLVGNTANDANAQVRFPSSDVLGEDSGFVDAQALQATSWFESHIGPDQRIVADPNTATAFVAYADATDVTDFPTYALTFQSGPPSPYVLARALLQHVGYLIVDRRMYTTLSAAGFYYDPQEPLAYARTSPLPLADYTSLLHQPWAKVIWTSSRYAILALRPLAVSAVTPKVIAAEQAALAKTPPPAV